MLPDLLRLIDWLRLWLREFDCDLLWLLLANMLWLLNALVLSALLPDLDLLKDCETDCDLL